MRGAARTLAGLIVAAAVLTAALPAPAAGQRGARMEESRLLRQAAAQESQGELEAAEATLRSLLERTPTSAGGLFALERVLRAQGRVEELLAVADAFLAAAPGAEGVRHLKLRVLADVDSLEALQGEARSWFALDPSDPGPYREVSRLWRRVLGPDEALEVLERGRTASGDSRALALEIGDLRQELGDEAAALDEWAEALIADPSRDAGVAERLRDLSDPREAARAVVTRLTADGPGPEQLGAAARLAVALGLEEEALEVGRRLAGRLDGRARGAFLADLARRAGDDAMSEVAAWAWGELGDEAGSVGERRQFDQRLVEASLLAGDTAMALEAQRRLADSFGERSADRRRAQARVIRLEAPSADPARLRRLLSAFRETFPDAPELDDLAAAVAERVMARGDVTAAAVLLDGVDGPRSNLMRGWILMSRGDVALGRQALLMAVPGLPPTEATDVIQLAGLLGRLSQGGVAVLAEARVQARQGEPVEASEQVEGALPDLPPEDRAPLLAEAARMTEEADPARAEALRRRIVEEHSDADEAAEAALELARAVARRPDGRAEAVAILERLITSRPGAAVVPTARRELERLRESGS